MNYRNGSSLATLALLVWAVTLNPQLSTVLAQGTAFTYQGRLSDGAGPATGLYDLRFSIWDAAAGGTKLATLTNSAVAVSNGLFTVTLDYGGGVFTGPDRWLQISVRTNSSPDAYAVLWPRQPMTPAPYAVLANGASNLLGSLPAGQLSGTLPNAALPANPGFSGTVAASAFAGDGAGVTNVNALTLNGLGAGQFWQLGGNMVAPGQFLGSTNDQAVEIWVGSWRTLRLEPNTNGAPNVIGGSPYNFVSNSVVGATIGGGGGVNLGGNSYTNSVTGNFGTVAGGSRNVAGGIVSTVGGGSYNLAPGRGATVSGGIANAANNNYGTVSGGFNNIAGGSQASVGGGVGNNASGDLSMVGGGNGNTAGFVATVGGGDWNAASGDFSTVGGGWSNQAVNAYATVPGGYMNVAGPYSFAAGQRAKALNQGAFVWADSQAADFSSTANDQFLIRAGGGVGVNKANPATTLDVAGTVTATAFSGDGSGLSNAGLLRVKVLTFYGLGGVSFTNTAFVKVADIGTFSKLQAGSTIEAVFEGRIYAGAQTGWATWELRVDDLPGLGWARAVLKDTEAGGTGHDAHITGIFTGLSAGNHTVSMWVIGGPYGGGSNAMLDPGNSLTAHVVVKELK